jgi:hypothetical protein
LRGRRRGRADRSRADAALRLASHGDASKGLGRRWLAEAP